MPVPAAGPAVSAEREAEPANGLGIRRVLAPLRGVPDPSATASSRLEQVSRLVYRIAEQ